MNYQWCIADNCGKDCGRCSFGNRENKKVGMSTTLIDIILRKIMQFDRNPVFAITGGDALLSKDFYYLISKLYKNNIKWKVIGNPLCVSDKACQDLIRFRCQSYQLCIDGLKDLHDNIYFSGSFDATVSAVKKLQLYKIPVEIVMNISSKNINQVCDVIRLCANLSVDIFTFIRYCSESENRINLILPEEYKELLAKIDSLSKVLKLNGWNALKIKDHLWELYAYENYGRRYSPEGFIRGCSCGIGHLDICSNGDVMACYRIKDSIVGNLILDNMSTIWSERMSAYRNFGNFEACSSCELWKICRGCPALAKSVSGSYYGRDPQCWKAL